MKKNLLVAVSLMAMLAGAANAQNFTLKLGGGFPSGDFADAKVSSSNGIEKWGLMNKDTKGGAGTGFNLGFEYRADIASVSGLGVVVSLDGFYNGLNEDLNDFFNDFRDDAEDNYDEFSLTTPSYINIPLMIGANYRYALNPSISLYATAAAGLNARFITPMKVSYEEKDGSETYEYEGTTNAESAFTFGFRLAAGVTFAERYSIEVGYYNLGTGKVKLKNENESSYTYNGHTERNSGSSKETLKSITPTLLTVRLGISF